MIPRQCKSLVEVDFPIAVLSKYAAREMRMTVKHLRRRRCGAQEKRA